MAYGRHLSCNTGPALMEDNGALQILGKADAMAAGMHILFSITAGTDCILRSTNIMKKWRMLQRNRVICVTHNPPCGTRNCISLNRSTIKRRLSGGDIKSGYSGTTADEMEIYQVFSHKNTGKASFKDTFPV